MEFDEMIGPELSAYWRWKVARMKIEHHNFDMRWLAKGGTMVWPTQAELRSVSVDKSMPEIELKQNYYSLYFLFSWWHLHRSWSFGGFESDCGQTNRDDDDKQTLALMKLKNMPRESRGRID